MSNKNAIITMSTMWIVCIYIAIQYGQYLTESQFEWVVSILLSLGIACLILGLVIILSIKKTKKNSK